MDLQTPCEDVAAERMGRAGLITLRRSSTTQGLERP